MSGVDQKRPTESGERCKRTTKKAQKKRSLSKSLSNCSCAELLGTQLPGRSLAAFADSHVSAPRTILPFFPKLSLPLACAAGSVAGPNPTRNKWRSERGARTHLSYIKRDLSSRELLIDLDFRSPVYPKDPTHRSYQGALPTQFSAAVTARNQLRETPVLGQPAPSERNRDRAPPPPEQRSCPSLPPGQPLLRTAPPRRAAAESRRAGNQRQAPSAPGPQQCLSGTAQVPAIPPPPHTPLGIVVAARSSVRLRLEDRLAEDSLFSSLAKQRRGKCRGWTRRGLQRVERDAKELQRRLRRRDLYRSLLVTAAAQNCLGPSYQAAALQLLQIPMSLPPGQSFRSSLSSPFPWRDQTYSMQPIPPSSLITGSWDSRFPSKKPPSIPEPSVSPCI
ncbi:uncharacterized protein LOC126651137 [Myiozetetes cayanensis]|uniref:uncharacterized protein LOC126651137 n=1 Tax=Myiozetetes cayanensis TaxID=478635 RepID=UPI00215E28D6|nr:uncharacterized protein LOC126651137 [Myiozetetes cayanensis]